MTDESGHTDRHFATLLRRLLDERGIASTDQVRWLYESVGPDGESFTNKANANDWLRNRRSGFISLRAFQGLELNLGLPAMVFVEANAADMGLTWGSGKPHPWWAPGWMKDFTEAEMATVVSVINTIGRARGLTE